MNRFSAYASRRRGARRLRKVPDGSQAGPSPHNWRLSLACPELSLPMSTPPFASRSMAMAVSATASYRALHERPEQLGFEIIALNDLADQAEIISDPLRLHHKPAFPAK